MRRIRIIFDLENWLWKTNFGTYWHLPITQFSKFDNFLWVCWFLGKNLSNFDLLFENSTTRIAIMYTRKYIKNKGKVYCNCTIRWHTERVFLLVFIFTFMKKECSFSFWHDFNPLWIESFAEVKSEKTGGSCLNLENSLKIHTTSY